MTESKVSKGSKSKRPFLISFICLILFLTYIMLPALGSAFIYTRWEDPEFRNIFINLNQTVNIYMPSNYYLRTGLIFFTVLTVYILPLYIMIRYWNMNRKAVKNCFYLCVLNIIVFFIHFRLIDELLYEYQFMKNVVLVLFLMNIFFLLIGFIHRKRMV